MTEDAYGRREESHLLELLRENLDRNNKERIVSSNLYTFTLEFRTASKKGIFLFYIHTPLYLHTISSLFNSSSIVFLPSVE
jgi:hypothetical protein